MTLLRRLCCLLLWLLPLVAFAQDPLDEINTLVYQYPAEAKVKITALEAAQRQDTPTELESLRLNLLKCELLLQLGESEAAIQLAQLGEATAQRLGANHVRPYFMSCLADAYSTFDKLQMALPLLDNAVKLAKRHRQPQALVMALRLRGQLDTEAGNFTSAIEDLRLALDAYDDIFDQHEHWAWPPKAFVYAALGNLLYASGDLEQAMHFTQLGLSSPECIGKVRQVLLLNGARIALDKGDTAMSDSLLKETRQLLPELQSPLELAISYAVIASIEIDRGRLDKAADLLKIALNTFDTQHKQLHQMRTRSLLARIEFAKGNDDQALKLMAQVLELANQLQLYDEQAQYQKRLANYYQAHGNFREAYRFLEKSYEAAGKANQASSNNRILQFKARLGQKNSDDNLQAELSSNPDERRGLTLGNVALLLVALILALLWWQRAKQSHHSDSEPPAEYDPSSLTPHQLLEQAVQAAKRGNYALSVVTFSIRAGQGADLYNLSETLRALLRETDMLLTMSQKDLLLVLPYASNLGAERIIEQLQSRLSEWRHCRILIGKASLHHFDSSETLLKRAGVQSLTGWSLEPQASAM